MSVLTPARAALFLAAAVGLLALCGAASAQVPKANGETLKIQNYSGTTGNMHAIVAKAKGFCEKYNFHCEPTTINSTSLGLQALIGKSIDVVQGGSDLVGASIIAGADIRIVGLSLPANVLAVSVRNDVPLPHRKDGYPAMMQDFKGKKIGVGARGTSSEKYFNMMLADVGLKPEDVTYVAIGNPVTGYAALAVGKQIDAIIMYQPLTQICQFNKTCETVIDMTIGEGPKSVAATIGSNVTFTMRRDMADGNPELMKAFYAAMTDTAKWFSDPANFEELLNIYKPIISFGDLEGADEMRRSWVKSVIPAYSKDLVVKRSALQQILDDSYEQKVLDKKLDAKDVLWDKAPQIP
jgi:NitT/TauT family transport system substrate-binding protein